MTMLICHIGLANCASSASSIFAIILFQDVYALHYAAHFFSIICYCYSYTQLKFVFVLVNYSG